MTQPRLVLYQRDDCHLCDLALEELAAARVPEFESVFIDDDPGLVARYDVRVPVLRDRERGEELGWPFDRDTVRRWLSLAVAAAALPLGVGTAGAAEGDVDLANLGVVAMTEPAADWAGRRLAEVLDLDGVDRIVLVKAVTSAPGDLDLANVRRILRGAVGEAHGGRRMRPGMLRMGSDDATWEGLLLMRSGEVFGFAIGADEICLTGAGGRRACWGEPGQDLSRPGATPPAY
ncbi:glutaredoxin family protein [Luteimonas sp. SJ-92]|uniref:Glutaredoxin family protein n=1 Tax=Luteimonas salinisoli TaxID=2752307 RepID=A0A853JI98_9GAMM|nr:glutaredoxin family protein [Luteimonas salinisoli]